MKKILLIAYFFPPSPAIGAIRPSGFAKYLPEFDWQPIVLTVEPRDKSLIHDHGENSYPVVRTKYIDIPSVFRRCLPVTGGKKRFSGRFPLTLDTSLSPPSESKNHLKKVMRELIFFPDQALGWYPSAVKAGLNCIRRYGVDIIWSTSQPVTTHLIAKYLKKKTGIPWVADLRDLWSQDIFEWFVEKSSIRQKLESRMDRRTLKEADAVVTISRPLAEQLKSFHISLWDRTHVITNGFDPDDFSDLTPSPAGKFVITYTGSVYGGARDPSLLFEAVSALIREKEIDRARFAINFYGSGMAPALLAKRYRLEDVVEVFEHLPRAGVLQAQVNSNVLLVIQWNPRAAAGAYTGKIFEYLGARRPILAIAPTESVISELLRNTRAGIASIEVSRLKEVIRDWYREYIARGTVQFIGREDEIRRFSYRNKTRELAAVLAGISGSARSLQQ